MSTIIITVLGIFASVLLLDGIVAIISTRHFERRQRFFRMAVKAPPHVDEQKYNLINRILAGLSSIGAGCVVLYWIFQYVSSGFQL